MIQEVKIQNFQSHEDTLFTLHPGINAIVGASDQGKSATLRALLWAIKNQPQGLAYISDWIKTKSGKIEAQEETRVSVTNGNGTLSRYRSASNNGYALPGENTMEALRTDVPDEVKTFFNLADVNIQRQADPPFMLSMSGGEIARFFNALVGMEEIAQAQTLVQGKQRSNDKALRTQKEELEEKELELEKYQGLDEILEEIEEGLKLQDEGEAIGLDQLHLKNSLRSSLEYKNIIKSLYSIEETKELLAEVENLERAKLATAGECGALETQLKQYKKLSKILKATEGIEAVSEDLDKAEGFEKDLQGLAPKTNELKTSLKKYKKLSKTLESCPDLGELLSELDELEVLEKKISKFSDMKVGLKGTLLNHSKLFKILKDLKFIIGCKQEELPDTCPECGNHLEEESHEH